MTYTKDEVIRIIDERVKGKIESAHDETGHHYRFVGTGEIVDSVTTKNILDKPHLVPWAIGLAIDFLEINDNWQRLKGPDRDILIKSAKLQYTDIRDEAGSIGGAAHKVIEDYEQEWITTGTKPENILSFMPENETRAQVFGAIRAAEQAFKKYNVTPVAFELLVGMPGVEAGTLDLIVINDAGELELWDHKTSNNVNDYYAIQTSAYKYFFEQMTGLVISRVKILKIDKWSDRFKVYNVPETDKAMEVFKAVSIAYDWLNNGKDKLIEDKVIVKI